ncbi:MAG: hypothetical protein HC836_34455 [Richelia sp. RM2_1_2]|nr:hypothetical protein [Richelia sp. RM2_1_2]
MYSQPWNSPNYYYNPYFPRYGSSRPYQPLSYGQNVAQEDIELKTYSSTLLFINEKGIVENDYSAKLEDLKISSMRQVSDVTHYNDSAIVVYRKNTTYFS